MFQQRTGHVGPSGHGSHFVLSLIFAFSFSLSALLIRTTPLITIHNSTTANKTSGNFHQHLVVNLFGCSSLASIAGALAILFRALLLTATSSSALCEMLKPDNCEGNVQSSSQMKNQLPPNGGYYLSQNAEDINSSFNILDGEVPNSVFDFTGTASPYLDMNGYLLPSGEELQPGTGSSKEVMIVYPGADMHTLDTHQDCQSSNPSNKNKAPRRKSTFFTIEEDIALVQAVLRHGTGRWKMIKDEAFGNDSRRTHTDLRDKWRSLVKTANLPAHKRRRVVPPEELLGMVRFVDQNGM
ncbi:hypothetical protein RHSIM_Rhsim13G0080800 [Rhododendron simsii]|uniref:Uncharacterized protein n=1 Tax=Rhododendron simsii TaxID=118357 RepID=A0A834FYZ2_RHOSS|nr:hypothetical protein RHSIM_Rhsim13G0080800 [Rhododendron simsii]